MSVTGQSQNRMDVTFATLKEKGETALIPFLTVGDPDPQTTVDVIMELEAAGANILELGVPYSDPLADGPVIQRASQRALTHRVTIDTCLHVAKQARERGSQMPFVLFTYYNPILQYGLDRFFEELQRNDISGMIIPDLPIEESEEMRARSRAAGVSLVPLVAPTSHERIASILNGAQGFVYCVSSLGVTGERTSFHSNVEQFIKSVQASTDLPVAVGFGISSHEQVKQFSAFCDGVVVGSAIVRQIESQIPLLTDPARKADGLQQIHQFVADLKGTR
ncbi:tryptophan synthase alpha chain [Paenibacillus hunanensis]|uniref:Tryptophan synthase alpha chain n=2 Tax=Paenibacillus hunanensis TaxID=539262 RepID=A0ABU1IW12_9BACL|nr:tryptophan synthase alpha chain [Paenibacillus hunanensis]GGJ11072.1 tryptophan synthase alpha chain [Paenibacillus hunanensis]